jgi:glycosyltransferase involved in cell wall biosynthesis
MRSGHVLMVLSNAYRPDPRVKREADGLVQAGFRVTLICWDRAAELSAAELIDGVEVIRVQGVRSRHGLGWRQLFYLPRFLNRAIRLGESLQPTAAHCHDLDTLYAGCALKNKLGCHLTYDSHENYPELMRAYLAGFLVTGLRQLESRLIRKVDLTITASTILRDELTTRGQRPVVTLGNYPSLDEFRPIDKASVMKAREELGVSKNQVLVAYIGGFSRNRALLPFIEAAALLPNVEFHLWGDGHQRPQVEEAVAQHRNAHYHGWLPVAQLPLYFQAADIIYYGLRKDDASSVYNAPNTVAQAMASGTPVIGTDIGDLGRMIRDTDCGVLLDETTPGQIASATESLLLPEFRERKGSKGLTAAVSKYNAENVQKKLVALYESFLAGGKEN